MFFYKEWQKSTLKCGIKVKIKKRKCAIGPLFVLSFGEVVRGRKFGDLYIFVLKKGRRIETGLIIKEA